MKTLRRSLLLSLVVALFGCNNMTTLNESDCWVFVGEADFRGVVIDTTIDGTVYMRKGACSAEDIETAIEMSK